jgi:hypothetical protein
VYLAHRGLLHQVQILAHRSHQVMLNQLLLVIRQLMIVQVKKSLLQQVHHRAMQQVHLVQVLVLQAQVIQVARQLVVRVIVHQHPLQAILHHRVYPNHQVMTQILKMVLQVTQVRWMNHHLPQAMVQL